MAKRFKITATGKVLFRGAGRRHLLQGKAPNAADRCARPRHLDQPMFTESPKISRSAIKLPVYNPKPNPRNSTVSRRASEWRTRQLLPRRSGT